MVHRTEVLANLSEAAKGLFRLVNSGELATLLKTQPRAERASFPSQRRLSPEEVDQLVADYRAGRGSSYDLAEGYGVHRQTVAGYLKDCGLVLGRTSLSPMERQRVVELHAAGVSANRIGLTMSRDPKTIRAALAKSPDRDA